MLNLTKLSLRETGSIVKNIFWYHIFKEISILNFIVEILIVLIPTKYCGRPVPVLRHYTV